MENNQPPEQLTKKERRELHREQQIEEKQKTVQRRVLRRIAKTALIIIAVAGSIGISVWYLANRQPVSGGGEIVSKRGLHWHPQLEIFVKGKKLEIPVNIGLGVVHKPIHTHDVSGTIHLEFQGVVRRDDLKLGKFFQVWNKNFMELGTSVNMTVNGEKNDELENYEMKDGDKIELRYE